MTSPPGFLRLKIRSGVGNVNLVGLELVEWLGAGFDVISVPLSQGPRRRRRPPLQGGHARKRGFAGVLSVGLSYKRAHRDTS